MVELISIRWHVEEVAVLLLYLQFIMAKDQFELDTRIPNGCLTSNSQWIAQFRGIGRSYRGKVAN